MLLAGDLFDSGEIYRETAQALAEALGTLRGRVFIAPGNHDFWDAGGPYGSVDWPDNVHIFKTEQIEAVEVPEKNCVVYGAAFTAPECTGDPLGSFRAPEDGRLHLMVLHGDTEGGGRYRPHPQRRDRGERPGLSGPGPYPRLQRPAVRRAHRLGLSRLPRGPGL